MILGPTTLTYLRQLTFFRCIIQRKFKINDPTKTTDVVKTSPLIKMGFARLITEIMNTSEPKSIFKNVSVTLLYRKLHLHGNVTVTSRPLSLSRQMKPWWLTVMSSGAHPFACIAAAALNCPAARRGCHQLDKGDQAVSTEMLTRSTRTPRRRIWNK